MSIPAGETATPTWEVAELWPLQGQWTESDYFSLPDTNRIVELSEGRLVMPPLPTFEHQRIVFDLAVRMRAFAEAEGLGVVAISPLPVRLWPGKIREPDIMFFSEEHRDRIGEKVCGVPDLVVEVTSESTERTDREEKLREYEKAGVGEYWIVDPEARVVEVYVLREGKYELSGRWGEGEKAKSEILRGFEVETEDIFAED